MPLLGAWISGFATLIEFGGGLLVVLGCVRGILSLCYGFDSRSSIVAARLVIADGIVAALGFKAAATLLKTIELRSWNAILMFAAILTLRTLIKQALVREQAAIRRTQHVER